MVKGVEYSIKRKKGLKYERNEIMGLHDHIRKTIWIESSIKQPHMLRVTLLHELFHAYLHQCGIGEGLDVQLEEVIVDMLAQCVDKHFSIDWKK
jgi:Zn-dependent peptidase ImmA (M78 family)